jgi:hypothetical protein
MNRTRMSKIHLNNTIPYTLSSIKRVLLAKFQ